MKNFITRAALVAGANALVGRGNTCCFELTASGGDSGLVRQLSDGQNRIGDHSLPPGHYCIGPNGGITDSHGRGCHFTPPTSQWQCDVGATPTTGFSINADGELEHDGSTHFVACETGDNGGLNIYAHQSSAVTGCKSVVLHANNCIPKPPPPAHCPTTLSSGNFEFPHLIIPIDSSHPNKAPGTSYDGEVTSTISSIFNFDIPASDAGKTCSLVFLFPHKNDLQTSSFTFSGDGKIDFEQLVSPATLSTTYNNAPAVAKNLGTITVAPGNSYAVSTFACPAGNTVAYEMKNAGTTSLDWFEDYNPSPIGLYITVC